MELSQKLIEDIGIKRYEHSIRVMEAAIKLTEIYGGDIDKARTASLLHDCAKLLDEKSLLKRISQFDIILDKVMVNNKELIHGPLGSKIAELEYDISDMEILDAIYYHTIGRPNMSLLEKIVYIADYIEPKRNFPGVEEVRSMAFIDLNQSIIMAMNNTIVFLIRNNKLIHPSTIETRNYLILNKTR